MIVRRRGMARYSRRGFGTTMIDPELPPPDPRDLETPYLQLPTPTIPTDPYGNPVVHTQSQGMGSGLLWVAAAFLVGVAISR